MINFRQEYVASHPEPKGAEMPLHSNCRNAHSCIVCLCAARKTLQHLPTGWMVPKDGWAELKTSSA